MYVLRINEKYILKHVYEYIHIKLFMYSFLKGVPEKVQKYLSIYSFNYCKSDIKIMQ